MRTATKFELKNFTALFDFLAIGLGFLSAYGLRFWLDIIPIEGDPPAFTAYLKALPVVLIIHLWMFRAYGLYEDTRRIRRIEEVFIVIKAVSISVIILMAATFIYRGWSYSRIYLVIAWILTILYVTFTRYICIQLEYNRKKQKKELLKVLVIGASNTTRQIIKWALHNPHYGHEIVGVLTRDGSLVGKHFEGVSILGEGVNWKNTVESVKPDQVILADPDFTRDEITELVFTCEDKMVEVKVVADIYGLMSRHVDVEYISKVPLMGFKDLPLDDLWNRMIKRTFDAVIAFVLFMSTLPLWIFLFIMIKLEDRGPLLYKQERVGRDGRTFDLLKFRTMRVDAEDETGPVWAKEDDDRRTRCGNFLRKWNLDELPQLLNVLTGEMSLVGPRPERPHFVSKFRETIPRYMARHKIKSGLTGWAAVNGYRGNTSIEERIKYDLYYMENWSLLFDIEILFMTFSSKSFKNAY